MRMVLISRLNWRPAGRTDTLSAALTKPGAGPGRGRWLHLLSSSPHQVFRRDLMTQRNSLLKDVMILLCNYALHPSWEWALRIRRKLMS